VCDLSSENDFTVIHHYANLGNVYAFDGDPGALILNPLVEYFIAEGTDVEYHWGKKRLVTPYLPLPKTFEPKYTGKGAVCYVMDDFNSLHGDTIVEVIYDMSPDAEVHKICINTPSIGGILHCFDEIMEHHLKTESITKVVNVSWSTLRHPFLDNIISGLAACNLLFVCAAGNTGDAVSLHFPANMECVLTVGCVDEYDRVVPFENVVCNYGAEIDVFAPGIDTNGHTGTSISSAIASSAALHYIEEMPASSADKLKRRILDSAKKDILYMDRGLYGDSPNILLQLPT